MKSQDTLSRRKFLHSAGLVAAVAAVPGIAVSSVTNKLVAKPKPKKAPPLPRRKLGRTGMEISDLSVGTTGNQTPAVMRYAMDKGVNFIHTSVNYVGGKAILGVAEAIKGRRDGLFLGLKITWSPGDDKAMDDALKKLGVKYVDIAFFNIHKAKEVEKDKYGKAAERWKKAGKFRFIGLTTHSEMKGCMEAALKQGFYDALMPAYNMEIAKECAPVLAKAEKQGVGVILMKTRHALDEKAYLKAVPKFLDTPGVTTICKTMPTFADVDKMIAAAQTTLSARELGRLERVARIAMIGRCAMCGACTNACPQGLPVADFVRCSDYYLADSEYYGTAEETYAAFAQRPTACTDCGVCEQVCAHNVPIRHHLQRLERVLA